MQTLTVTRVDVPACKLGEGPVWDVDEQALYYVDAAGFALHRYDPATGDLKTWNFDGRVACLGIRRDGGAILALWNGMHLFDFATGELTLIGDPDPDQPRTSLNDGKVDPRGRYICGSVDLQVSAPLGKLYSIGSDGAIDVLDQDITVANGPCWSPDGTTFYHADSVPKTIYAYDYDLDTGAVANRRVFAKTDSLGGIPDGATVDAEGYLWTAVCEGGVVARFAPDGTLDRTVELPTSMVSSVMFGGPDLDRLFVTSIDPRTFGKEAEEDGGRMFVIDGLGVRGLPEHRYAG
jgi:L-arabinonolactonase